MSVFLEPCLKPVHLVPQPYFIDEENETQEGEMTYDHTAAFKRQVRKKGGFKKKTFTGLLNY